MKNTTRNTLLITVATAALMVGAGLASAQDTKEKGEAPAAAAHDQNVPAEKMDHQPGSLPQKSPAPTAQAPMKEKPAVTAQKPTDSKPETSGQGSAAKTSEQPNAHTGSSVAKDDAKSGAPAALSTEQHAKIRDTLRGGSAEHLTNVQFSVTVGGVIPGTVHLYALPGSVVEYAPQYRDYEYILVGDEILIVDPRSLRIVAVIAA
jgi:type IV secretory pathway VirB10-like protein